VCVCVCVVNVCVCVCVCVANVCEDGRGRVRWDVATWAGPKGSSAESSTLAMLASANLTRSSNEHLKAKVSMYNSFSSFHSSLLFSLSFTCCFRRCSPVDFQPTQSVPSQRLPLAALLSLSLSFFTVLFSLTCCFRRCLPGEPSTSAAHPFPTVSSHRTAAALLFLFSLSLSLAVSVDVCQVNLKPAQPILSQQFLLAKHHHQLSSLSLSLCLSFFTPPFSLTCCFRRCWPGEP
jgi:hypothetical protein